MRCLDNNESNIPQQVYPGMWFSKCFPTFDLLTFLPIRLPHGVLSLFPFFFLEEADSMELNVSSISQSQEMAELRRLPLGSSGLCG